MNALSARRDNRYAARVDFKAAVVLRQFGSAHRFEVDIANLSLTGFGCSTVFPLNVGQVVSVTLPSLAPLESRVIWVDNSRFGCAFDRSLHIAVFDHLVRRYRRTADVPVA